MPRTKQSSKQTVKRLLKRTPIIEPIVDPKPISSVEYDSSKYRQSLKEQLASRRELLRSEM